MGKGRFGRVCALRCRGVFMLCAGRHADVMGWERCARGGVVAEGSCVRREVVVWYVSTGIFLGGGNLFRFHSLPLYLIVPHSPSLSISITISLSPPGPV